MALITCPQCGKSISDKARKCPHCNLNLEVKNIPLETQFVPITNQKLQSQKVEETQKNSRKDWPAFLAGIGCVSVVVAAIWFFVVNDKNVSNQEPMIAEKTVADENIQQYSESERVFSSISNFEQLMNLDASTYLFTESDLASLTPKELSYLRNQIYAIHGYVFKSQELTDYFSQFSWYIPNPSVTGKELNNIEKANAEFIKKYQKENGKTYQLDSK